MAGILGSDIRIDYHYTINFTTIFNQYGYDLITDISSCSISGSSGTITTIIRHRRDELFMDLLILPSFGQYMETIRRRHLMCFLTNASMLSSLVLTFPHGIIFE